MRKSNLYDRSVMLFTVLHTAIVIMLIFILIFGAMPTGNAILTVFLIASVLAVTVYTSRKTSCLLRDEMDFQKKDLMKCASILQAESAKLDSRERMMDERQIAFERNVALIGDYGRKMTDLVALIDQDDTTVKDVSAVQTTAANMANGNPDSPDPLSHPTGCDCVFKGQAT